MQTPLTICIPGPQAWRTLTSTSSGDGSDARGIASADDIKAKANTATIDLIMTCLPC
jgi:hypothetical protein